MKKIILRGKLVRKVKKSGEEVLWFFFKVGSHAKGGRCQPFSLVSHGEGEGKETISPHWFPTQVFTGYPVKGILAVYHVYKHEREEGEKVPDIWKWGFRS